MLLVFLLKWQGFGVEVRSASRKEGPLSSRASPLLALVPQWFLSAMKIAGGGLHMVPAVAKYGPHPVS